MILPTYGLYCGAIPGTSLLWSQAGTTADLFSGRMAQVAFQAAGLDAARFAGLTRARDIVTWNQSRIFTGTSLAAAILETTGLYYHSNFRDLIDLLDDYDAAVWNDVALELAERVCLNRLKPFEIEELRSVLADIAPMTLSTYGEGRLSELTGVFHDLWRTCEALAKWEDPDPRDLVHYLEILEQNDRLAGEPLLKVLRKIYALFHGGRMEGKKDAAAIGWQLFSRGVPPTLFLEAVPADGAPTRETALRKIMASYWLTIDRNRPEMILKNHALFADPKMRPFYSSEGLAELIVEHHLDDVDLIASLRKQDPTLRSAMISAIKAFPWGLDSISTLTNFVVFFDLKGSDLSHKRRKAVCEFVFEIEDQETLSVLLRNDVPLESDKREILSRILRDRNWSDVDLTAFEPSYLAAALVRDAEEFEQRWILLTDIADRLIDRENFQVSAHYYRDLLRAFKNEPYNTGRLRFVKLPRDDSPYLRLLELYHLERLGQLPDEAFSRLSRENIEPIYRLDNNDSLRGLEESLLTHGVSFRITYPFMKAVVANPNYAYDGKRIAAAAQWLADHPLPPEGSDPEEAARIDEDRAGVLSLARTLALSETHRPAFLKDLQTLMDEGRPAAQEMFQDFFPQLRLNDPDVIDHALNFLRAVALTLDDLENIIERFEIAMDRNMASWVLETLAQLGPQSAYSTKMEQTLREIARLVSDATSLGRKYRTLLDLHR